jgi:hypothetical protein
MIFNYGTVHYLKEMEAKLIKSEYKITSINFEGLVAFVNKVDTYQKRNGKLCTVEHHFGKWVSFKKEDVRYGQQNHISFDSSVHGLEEIHGTHTVKYLTKETKKKIVAEWVKENSK